MKMASWTQLSEIQDLSFAFLPFQAEGQVDPKLYFWDVEMDTVSYFNFETGRGEQDDYATAGAVEGQDEDKDTNDAERSVGELCNLSNLLLTLVGLIY
jgi:hypothetical protein